MIGNGGGMDEAALYEWLAQAEQTNPGAIQQMIDAGLFDDRMGVEGQTMSLGKGMFDRPQAQGMRVGGTYVAASPTEHLSNAMANIIGAWKMNDSQKRQQSLIGQKGRGMEALIRAMSGPKPQQAVPPQGPQYGPGSAAPPWDPRTLPYLEDEYT